MSLREDLGDRLDPVLKLPIGANGGRDNIIKDTAVALMLEIPSRRAEWIPWVKKFFDQTRISDGLYHREPNNLTPNSLDNVIGAIVAAKLAGLDQVCFDIVDRLYNFNATYSMTDWRGKFQWWRPSTWKLRDDWYGRFVGFPPWAKSAASLPSYKVSSVSLFLFYLSVVFTASTPHDNTSDKILLWLEMQLMPVNRWFARLAHNQWHKMMQRQYPGGPREMLGVYYGADHPFTEAAPSVW